MEPSAPPTASALGAALAGVVDMHFDRMVDRPTGWKCTGYMHGCFCPSCGERDIARAEYIRAGRYGHG